MKEPTEDKRGEASFGEVIRRFRREKGLNQPELAEALEITANAISNWEAGRTRPDLAMVPRLCDTLGIPVSVFFGRSGTSELPPQELALLNDFRRLDPDHRRYAARAVRAFVEQQDEDFRTYCRDTFIAIQSNEATASAGYGSMLGEGETHTVYVRRSAETLAADEIILVNGNSMFPTFRDGDRLLVKRASSVRPGEIGVFIVGGEGYVKEYQPDGLHSHNRAYKTMRFSEFTDVHCYGRVIGSLEDSDFASFREDRMLESIRKEDERKAKKRIPSR